MGIVLLTIFLMMRNSLYALCLLAVIACSKKQEVEPQKPPIKLPEAMSGLKCDYRNLTENDSAPPYRLINTHQDSEGRIYLYYDKARGTTVVNAYIKMGLRDDTTRFDETSIALPCNLPDAYKINHLRVFFSGEETNEVKFAVGSSLHRPKYYYGTFLRLSSIKPNPKQ